MGVSLTQGRDQIRDISGVHYDSKLKKITFPSDPKTTPQMLFCETYLSGDDSDNQSGDLTEARANLAARTKNKIREKWEERPFSSTTRLTWNPFCCSLAGKRANRFSNGARFERGKSTYETKPLSPSFPTPCTILTQKHIQLN